MRWIELRGAANVRDLGGLPTHNGASTLGGRLFRADNLQGLSSSDVQTLVDKHGVRTVVDLRTTDEVASEGPGPLVRVESVRHAHHSVIPEVGERTDTLATTRWNRIVQRYPDDIMCAVYLGYLEDRPKGVIGALETISTAQGASVVHCAAGKDRTGVVVALALSAVGVRRDAVVSASGERIAAILDRLRSSPTYANNIDRIAVDAHTPQARSMEAFLDQVEVRYGGVLGWLASHGFGAHHVQLLRERLLGDLGP